MARPDERGVPDVFVAVVAYNSDDCLSVCLDSLRKQDDVRCQSVVVDNARSASTQALVATHFPEVAYVEPAGNIGFARAVNMALQRYRSGYMLLLNPDTALPPGALTRLISTLESNPGIGMVGPKLLRENGELDHACKRGLPTPQASLAYFLRLDRVWPERFGHYRAAGSDEDREADVEAINGACMLVREDALKSVGQLDERFWMYGEDLDWCKRFADQGWRIRYVPVPVLHVKAASSGTVRSPRVTWAFHNAMWLYYRKHHARLSTLPVSLCVFIGVHAKFLIAVTRSFAAVVAERRRTARRRLASVVAR